MVEKGRLVREARERQPGLRGFLYWWLESPYNSGKKAMDLVLLGAIICSVVVVLVQIHLEPDQFVVLNALNGFFLVFFICEYFCRFSIGTDLIADIRDQGLRLAMANKLRWMLRPLNIIDLLAIIPIIRSLRALRLVRLLRVTRLLRIFKLARYTGDLSGYIQEIRKKSQELVSIGLITLCLIVMSGIIVFCVEKPAGNAQIKTLWDAMWWSIVTLTTVGYGDVYPVTALGRGMAVLLMLFSLATIGAFGGLVTSILMSRIDDLKAGLVERVNLCDHVLFCGWNPCAHTAARILMEAGFLEEHNLVVLASETPEQPGFGIYVKGSSASLEDLQRAGAERASIIAVFHDQTGEGNRETADMSAILTTLHVQGMAQHIPMIVQLYDKDELTSIAGEAEHIEILAKETLEAEIMVNTIRNHGHTSDMLFELSDFKGSRIRTMSVADLCGTEDKAWTVRAIKRLLLQEYDRRMLLGFQPENGHAPVLNPSHGVTLPLTSILYILENPHAS